MKKLLYSKEMPAIIGVAAVIIFFIWGFIEKTYTHAWLIFLVAGLIDLVIVAMRKGSEGSVKPTEPKEEVTVEPEIKQ